MNKTDSLIVELCNGAQRLLEKDNILSPVAMIIKGEDDLIPCMLPFKNDKEKLALYFALGVAMKEKGCHRVIIITDVAVRKIDMNPENAEKVKEYFKRNILTEQPLTYPESMREDGIYLQLIDFEEDRSDAYFKRYENRKDTPRFYHELVRMNKNAGKIGGDIYEYVKRGYELEGVEFHGLIDPLFDFPPDFFPSVGS